MLRIKIELVPYGIESRKRIIGEMQIINTGDNKNRPEYGNYTVIVNDDGKTKNARILDHYRNDSPWVLIRKAIEAIK